MNSVILSTFSSCVCDVSREYNKMCIKCSNYSCIECVADLKYIECHGLPDYLMVRYGNCNHEDFLMTEEMIRNAHYLFKKNL
jgi:hypothetical protein